MCNKKTRPLRNILCKGTTTNNNNDKNNNNNNNKYLCTHEYTNINNVLSHRLL